MKPENLTPLVEVTRGHIVESIHFGALVVVDSSGQLLFKSGDPKTVTFLRSSAKPFQALPFFETGGAEIFGLSEREVAVICASHSGTDEHVQVVRGIQQKAGVSEGNLQCGCHPPMDPATVRLLWQRGEEPTPIRHNCSGKHSGMLAHAVMRNLPLEDYLNPQHPIQQSILKAFAELCSMKSEEVVVGIDGCSAPNFAVPLYNAALGYARLFDPAQLSAKRGEACQLITRSMSGNGFMVGGPGRFDTLLMEVGNGKIVSKGGAEGYQGLALAPGTAGNNKAIGIAFKVSDGDADGTRAGHAVAVEILRRLGALNEEQLSLMADFDSHLLYNWRKLTVGELRTCF
ncbi:MAG: asparaginase [Anaerolineaceae bacterium]|nr:asparaginase [Anaerolineaceae bacterium]